ncbi:MAG: hypothetical protein ACP5IL_16840, partial [Syntrophobacteraceae bacterium]
MPTLPMRLPRRNFRKANSLRISGLRTLRGKIVGPGHRHLLGNGRGSGKLGSRVCDEACCLRATARNRGRFIRTRLRRGYSIGRIFNQTLRRIIRNFSACGVCARRYFILSRLDFQIDLSESFGLHLQ